MSGNLVYIKDACGLAQAEGLASLIYQNLSLK